jgi:hypothetical protein
MGKAWHNGGVVMAQRRQSGSAWATVPVHSKLPCRGPALSWELAAAWQQWLPADVGSDVGYGQMGCARRKGSPHRARAATPLPFDPNTIHIVYKVSAACLGAADALWVPGWVGVFTYKG